MGTVLSAVSSTESTRSVGVHVSSFCSAGNCVAVVQVSDGVIVVDTKAGITGPVLRFTLEEWAAFLAGVKNGEFDSP